MSRRITRLAVLHGYGVSPRSMWFPWLHAFVEKSGVGVFLPALPGPFKPNLRAWLRAVAPQARTWGEETAIVAHSAGGILALRLIEREVRKKVGPVILIGSPYASRLTERTYVSFFDKPIDWAKLRAKAASYTVIHAKDDVIVPHDHMLRYAESLEARPVLLNKGGHFIGKTMPKLAKELEKLLRS